jgi:hypothetical protein
VGTLIAFMLDGLPLRPAAKRAVAATIADWSHEAERAPHQVARLGVATCSTVALVRVIASSATRELRSEVRSPFLWRTLVACAVVVLLAGFIEPMFPTEARGRWAELMMGMAQGLYVGSIFIPLAVFAAEVTGRSSRQAPSLASAMVLAAAILMWVAVVAPETLNFMWTIHQWGPDTEVVPPVPSVVRWFTGEPTKQPTPLFIFNRALAWVCFSVSFWSLTVLAYRVRTFAAGSIGGKLAIVCGSVLLGGVLLPTVVIFPRLTAIGRVPYLWTGVIGLLSVAAFSAAAALARKTAARAEALALQMSRS